MAHLDYDFSALDTGSKVRVAFIDKATGMKLVPFNGVFNATLLVKPQGGAMAPRTMSVLSGADDGSAEYQFTAAELVAGELQTQAVVTRISNGQIVSELGIKVYKIGPKLS
jgi:hypothetical protein